MREKELQQIELARQQRLLTRRQAEIIREEMDLHPGVTAGELMLRRHYVTEDQLTELEAFIASMDLDFDLGADESSRRDAPPKDATQPLDAAHPRPKAPPPTPTPTGGAPSSEDPDTDAGLGDERDLETPQPEPPATGGAPALPRNLAGFLQIARHWGASDLHIAVGRPPFFRINGTHRHMEVEPLSAEQARQLNFSALTEKQARQAQEDLQLDFALEVRGIGRYRCNVFKHRLGWDGAYRVIATTIPTIEELGLPATVKVFTEYHQGLVMITGPGGAGKTTTALSLLDLVNRGRRDHIITVEDPVEYILPPQHCQVTQREVGRHTQSFASALRAALREDPDIILVGELRDYETTSIAISAAETGHLVFSTMGTSSAARTVARIVDVYPSSQQAQVCTMVAESLRGVISQLLLPRRDHQGRALAYEILVNTSGIAQQIKEGKTHLITSLIQNAKKQGMCLMDDSLRRLFEEGTISGRTAHRFAETKGHFEAHKNDD